MDVLDAVTPFGWLQLGLALALFIGPGLALGELLRAGRRLDVTQSVALACSASLAFWSVLLGVLKLVSLSLSPPAVWIVMAAGWLAYGWLRWRRRRTPETPLTNDSSIAATALLWLVVAATAVVSIWALRGVVVQPGSDGYHHTLIAQAIAAHGGLPDNLLPLTPLMSFSYHFGYHGFVAYANWMTGISVVALVPLLAQLLKAVAALSVAFLVEAMGGRRSGAIVAAAITGLVAVFPAYYVNWGRNTQLTGLLMMAVLLGIVWLWTMVRPAWPTALLIGLLAAGIALVHYRVTLMVGIGCALVVLAGAVGDRWPRTTWRTRAAQIAGMVAAAALLVAPWVWQVFQARTVGYATPVNEPAASFFQLDRLGRYVLDYPTNWPVLVLLALATGWGLWRRNRGVLVMAAWLAMLFALSLPWAFGQYMDTNTIVLSLFVPGAAVIGLAAGDFMEGSAGAPPRRRWVVAVPMVLLAALGAVNIVRIVEPGAPYVQAADLPAAAWVQTQTPPDARFMVNTFRFDFMPDFVLGSDAGSWLPVLAGRSAVTAPMHYPVERNQWPDYEPRINALADLGGDLTTPAAIARLRQEGVTHVFVGARGGPILAEPLMASPAYETVYAAPPVYIFRLKEPEED